MQRIDNPVNNLSICMCLGSTAGCRQHIQRVRERERAVASCSGLLASMEREGQRESEKKR